jgi:hypothetical protein
MRAGDRLEQQAVIVGMNIDKARRDDPRACVEAALRRLCAQVAQHRDAPVADAHVTRVARGARAVDDGAVFNH